MFLSDKFKQDDDYTYKMNVEHILPFLNSLPGVKVNQFLKRGHGIGEEKIPELIPGADVEIPEEEKVEKQDDYFENSFIVLRVSAFNFNKKKTKIEVQIKSEDDAPNFFAPLCSIQSEIYSENYKSIAYFHKIHPRRPFGKYSFTFITDAIQEEAQPAEQANDPAHQDSANFNHADDFPEVDNFDTEQSQINCGACTMFNPRTNEKCSICGTPLPK